MLIVLFMSGITHADNSDGLQFHTDIKPIFDTKCISCHACYDAPCQLILTSQNGLLRGANKTEVYTPPGVKPDNPTRLHIDAHHPTDWRDKGFSSVLTAEQAPSLLAQMIDLGKSKTYEHNSKLPETISLNLQRQNSCPVNEEFANYQANHPHGGMPFAVSGLTDKEYQTLSTWLEQGANTKSAGIVVSEQAKHQIEQWETFLNQADLKSKLVARYLYEHLFIAHLYFPNLGDKQFYKVVRSATPPGKAIYPIATVRPNENPNQQFWYRIHPITDTIVYKTHITYPLSPEKMARFESLFLKDNWTISSLPNFNDNKRSNPFITFQAIPAAARYQFLLDDATYFIRTFIRGPVCHGQVATAVIQDRFWAYFQSPDKDEYVTNTAYREKTTPLLSIPGTDDDLLDFIPEWSEHHEKNNQYRALRQQQYRNKHPNGIDLDFIWDGDGSNTSAFQTVFRHHNSAANAQGLIGETPSTTWLIDYPLLERSYYLLVANFNVFGNISHQTLTRQYFDLIRYGAEQNFLTLLPPEQRKNLQDNAYQNLAELKLYLTYQDTDNVTPVNIDYQTDAPMLELTDLIKSRFKDVIYSQKLPESEQAGYQSLHALTKSTAEQLPVINYLPDLSFVTIEHENGAPLSVFSMVRNRFHTNVAFILGESLRYRPSKDTLTIYPGVLGSYPNFIYHVKAKQLAAFQDELTRIASDEAFAAFNKKWGIRRTHNAFWTHFHQLTDYLKRTNPVEAGIMDMNRYENL